MTLDPSRTERRLEREKAARQEAERLLEEKSSELYVKNQELANLSESLEKLVAKRTIAMQRARDEALTSLKIKTDFIANMSHELRTPMNGVLGVLALLGDHKLSAEQRELLNVAESSGHHLLGIINDILDFSKIEANKVSLEYSPILVREYFQSTCGPFKLQTEQKAIDFDLQIEDNVPEALMLDKLRFTQILSNLLSNAIKFTKSGGVFVRFMRFGSGYRLSVADSGIGMSDKHLKTIFEAFEQADTSITREFGGTGLGMNITKRLVDMFEGEISVESTLGQGSVFHVDMHLKTADTQVQRQVAPAEPSDSDLANSRILLVEDNPINQLVANKILTQWQCEVDIAENGEVALELLAQQRYSVVLMDLQMPVMGGVEATVKLRTEGNLNQNVPIIAMTAHNSPEHIKECLEVGMQEHLPKPIDRDLLKSLLETYLPKTDLVETEDEQQPDPVVASLTIEGIDLVDSLRRVSGDWPLLYSLLMRFIQEYIHLADKLSAFKADNDVEAGIILTHKVKGGSANLGMMALSRVCAEFERNLQARQEWPSEQALDELNNMLKALNANLELVDNPNSKHVSVELKEISKQDLHSKLTEIVVLLNKDILAAEELLGELHECKLPDDVSEALTEAQVAMDQFDTGRVEQMLSTAIGHTG